MSKVRPIDNPPSSEPKCKICNDTNFVEGRGGLIPCECAIERRVVARIPPRYRDASLTDFKRSVQDFVLLWFSSKPTTGLLITGKVGCGKTYLAAAMCRSQLLIREQNLRFDRFADFYSRLRESYRTNAPEESIFGNLTKVKYLYLDDLGTGSLSDHERRATHDLLDRRWNAELPTIITTNWTIEQIAARMDDRIADRLQSYVPLLLEGESRRGEAAPI